VTPINAARHRRRVPTWAFACLILVLATVAAFGVSALRERADDARHERFVLERLRGLTNEQSSLELEAVVAPAARSQLVRAVQAKRILLEHTLARLEPKTALRLEALLEAHQDALRRELQLLSSGRVQAAFEVAQQKVDPSLARLLAAVDEASKRNSSEASAASLDANAGAGFLLALVAVLLVLLFRAVQRARSSLDGAEKRALRESERWFRSLVQNASELIVVVDPDTTVRYATDSITSLLGYRLEEVVGRKLVELAHPGDAGHLRRVAASEPSGHALECRLWSRAGTLISMEWVQGVRPDAPGCILTGRDVSERKQLEQELRHQAFHDSLTGLANRALFEDRLSHALAGLARTGGGLTVLFLDLDDFTTVNDSLGHPAGDDLLRAIGERLRHNLRDGDTVARLGGDEFGVLLDDAATSAAAGEAARRLLAALERPFLLDGRRLKVTASIGIALGDGHSDTLQLMRNADLAMYEAKRRGGGRWRVFEESMHAVALGRLELGSQLQRAVEEQQFELRYQPIVRLHDTAVVGAEALLRWRHPDRGLLSPEEFLPLAEQTNLIVQVGRWALTEACGTLAGWQATFPRTEPLVLSVNISMRQLHEQDVVDVVRGALADAPLEAKQLVLEITESFLADEAEGALGRLQRLRALGVRLAVDDFGTGYSALSYLQRFPIDILKIDRSFVQHARRASASLSLVRSIVQLGRSLHLDLVAEGIEDAEQAEELLAMGVRSGQGFYYAEPLDAKRFGVLLATDAQRRLPA
jgi:diguanylate cyclase (GGDEF)-like protein/PAS domain S-box-containing protein